MFAAARTRRLPRLALRRARAGRPLELHERHRQVRPDPRLDAGGDAELRGLLGVRRRPVRARRPSARMAGHLARLLERLAGRPRLAPSRLPLLTPRRARHSSRRGMRRGATYPRGRCLHELFEAQARRTPGRRGRWSARTSAHLRRAETRGPTRLAHRLRRARRGPRGAGGHLPGALARSWSSPSSASSRPAAPTCRSIPPTRASGWRFMLEDAARAVLVTRGSLAATGCRRRRLRASPCLDADAADAIAGGGPSAAPLASAGGRAGQPGLRHLHLRLHRPAQGGGHRAPQRRGDLLGWARRGVRGAGAWPTGARGDLVCFDLSVFELFVPLSWRRHGGAGARGGRWRCPRCRRRAR